MNTENATQKQRADIIVNLDRWPLIYVRFIGSPDAAIMERYLRELERAISRREKRVMIIDATDASMVSAAARKMQADWMAKHDENTRMFTMGCAFVLSSAVIRGALTAVLWLQPLSCPHAVVKDVPTALERCRLWLEPHGLHVPT